MAIFGGRFEEELVKRITEELERLRGELEDGVAIKDYADYKKYTGLIRALKKTLNEFIPEIHETLEKGR